MSFEVACTQCQGRLLVEQAGVVVACPHCGTHLSVPAAEQLDTQVESPQADAVQPTPEPTPFIPEPQQPASEAQQPALQQITPEPQQPNLTPQQTDPAPQQIVQENQQPASQPPQVSAEPQAQQPFFAPPTDSPFGGDQAPLFNPVQEPTVAAPSSEPSETTPEIEAKPDETIQSPEATQQSTPIDPSPAAVAQDANSPQTSDDPIGSATPAALQPVERPAAATVPKSRFNLVMSWASAATIATLFLLFQLLNAGTSNLESLPDVRPQKKKDDTYGWKRVDEDAVMPPGHSLALGQTQRYGNLKVTPVRVTRSPIEFEHHLGNADITRPPGPDVLKLWIEFENVSDDQEIAPLDALVFLRDDADIDNIRSNTFLCRESQKKADGERVMVYELNENDIWNLTGQNLHYELKPGESGETYVPTSSQGIDSIVNSDEPLVWRIYFRKGYSPKNYGVTTVIEVTFDSSQIETGNPKPEEAPAEQNA